MSTSTEIQETLLKAIDAVITQRNNELKLDKTITATIKKNVGTKHGKPVYQVEYSGGLIEATAQNANDAYVPHTGVYVMIPEGNFSNEKIIIGRANSIQENRSTSVIAAAVNKYSIVGSNLLESSTQDSIANMQFGLRSFHPRTADDTHGVNHRAQFIYQAEGSNNTLNFRNDNLKIYKDDTTAIMIKAEFLTNLEGTQRRQPSARYGLIFNFAFDNLNKGFGETNREILENVAKIVTGQYEKVTYENNQIINTQTIDANLLSLIQDFENSLELGNNIRYYTQDNTGKIDQTIEYIQTMYSSFQSSFPELDKEIINNTINAYLTLLKECKYFNGLMAINEHYQTWLQEVVGDGPQKFEQFVLSSDDMIGNPMAFSTWNTQYSVFKINLDTFNHLDSILFYKEGFIESKSYENQWPIGNPGPDIFVKNIQIYAMNPLDEQSGDYTIKVEPSAGQDIIISSAKPQTQFKATVLRKMYEDLTRNGKMNYLWFKEDSSIINANVEGYHYLGGIGWRKLDHTEANYLFTTTLAQNKAYKNNYKCVAIYEPSTDDKTILSYSFSVYNKDAAIDLKLESDIGTAFSFDAGIPTIKVLINEDRINSDDFNEIGYAPDAEDNERLYKYNWAIADAANNYTIFLDEVFEETKFTETTAEDAMLISAKKSTLKKIKAYTAYYRGNDLTVEEVIEAYKATRIAYPVSIGSSGFTVFCYLKKYDNGSYYDVGSASLDFINNDTEIVSDYRIQIINGDQIFQYDEYGNSPCSEKKKDPLQIKPIQAKLLTPSGIEVEGSNYTVEWIFPIEDSLLSTTDPLVLNPTTNLEQNHIGQELTFSIAKLFDPNTYNNQITCHVYFNGKNYYKDTNFYIGKQGNNGTNGTDVVAKIDVVGNDLSNVLIEQPLTLYVQKNYNAATAMWNIDSSRQMSPQIDLISNKIGLKLNVYQKGLLIGEDSYDMGYPHWNLAGNASETDQTTGKYFSIKDKASQIQWNYSTNNTQEYFRLQNIRAEVSLNKENEKQQIYYAFFSLPIIEYENRIGSLNVANLLTKNRIAIDKKYYLNEIIYNQDGRNPVYNHNQGLKIINIPENITRAVFKAKGGWNANRSDSGRILEVLEDNPDFALLLEKDSNESEKTNEIEITNFDNNEAMVYIIPNDTCGGSQTNNRVEVELYYNDSLIATVYAPIHIALNTFGLASLNAWDGNTVKIDEKNGYVMAPQVGAGEKDPNNRFTGVLMGKTETYTGGGDAEKQTGLFGYSHGLQSIFLDSETGNATFGLPDKYTFIFDKTTETPVPTTEGDEYNEGRIELRPGNVSKIGGWILGRRSIYYTRKPVSEKMAIDENGDPIKDADGNPIVDANGNPVIGEYIYDYSGEIGQPYENDLDTPLNKQYAEFHEKDINREDSGLLLSADPSYISIKGKKLGYNDINNGLNSQLIIGDSLEIQLDPQTPTLFTIFRHNGEHRGKAYRGKRQYLAGINDKGELLANGMGKQDDGGTGTKSGNIILKAFKDTVDMPSGSYVGAVFETGENLASTRTFFQIFREKKNPLSSTSPVYLTGGQTTSSGDYVDATGNEYQRPISVHGKNIALYADTGTPNEYVLDKNGEKIPVYDNIPQYDEEGNLITDKDGNPIYNPVLDEDGNPLYYKYDHNWTSTDANVKISTNGYQTQLGDTKLVLYRNANYTNSQGNPVDYNNYLTTMGRITINAGSSDSRKKITINAANTNVNLYEGTTRYYCKNINNENGINIETSRDFIHYGENNNYSIYTYKLIDSYKQDYSETESFLTLNSDNSVKIGYQQITIKDKPKNPQKDVVKGSYKNLITLDKNNGMWETNSDLELKSNNYFRIYDEKNIDNVGYTPSTPQILIQAGSGDYPVKFTLNSSNNNWGSQEITSTNEMTAQGAWCSIHNSEGNGLFLYESKYSTKMGTYALLSGQLEVSNGVHIFGGKWGENTTLLDIGGTAATIQFNKTNFSGKDKSPSYNDAGYYSVNDITTLKDAIDNCLKAAGAAKDAADKAQARADEAYNHLVSHNHNVTINAHTFSTDASVAKADVAKAAAAKVSRLNATESYWQAGGSNSSVQRTDTGVTVETPTYVAPNLSTGLRNAYPEAAIDLENTSSISKTVYWPDENKVIPTSYTEI